MYIYIILQLGSKGDAREIAYNVYISNQFRQVSIYAFRAVHIP